MVRRYVTVDRDNPVLPAGVVTATGLAKLIDIPESSVGVPGTMVFQGPWTDGQEYPVGSVVSFSGSLFYCQAEVSAEVATTENPLPSESSGYWELLVMGVPVVGAPGSVLWSDSDGTGPFWGYPPEIEIPDTGDLELSPVNGWTSFYASVSRHENTVTLSFQNVDPSESSSVVAFELEAGFWPTDISVFIIPLISNTGLAYITGNGNVRFQTEETVSPDGIFSISWRTHDSWPTT